MLLHDKFKFDALILDAFTLCLYCNVAIVCLLAFTLLSQTKSGGSHPMDFIENAYIKCSQCSAFKSRSI
ncbi:hypothetical protein VNO77_22262 [Canavalia gladiata]|uniref:Uncharacterized protein n=1 Tax=Canavalia gladiata TaxID=3824 RepID=A0AAN9L298_CANGL